MANKVLLSVTFDADFTLEEPSEATLARAHAMLDQPGLQWKLWLRDEAGNRGGGVYLFDDRETAEAWAKGEMTDSAQRFPWITNLEYRAFEVREELSAITRGPLDVRGGE
ncbi:YdhR family protein [Conexibacter stalactiti]|uniref:YdhR family protein n=1 Tax=Conexibacter stalactiti TaxID=1940611 RepID=A0ABU4HRA0_9ACTN|nr:YdhR family protein [Conexibacter stalactiti]MDW5595070.1 YdhR family protein [Conexibacter stalactiti]MEC5035712.1 YdhR family protein [Conexibacter stalactiti]